MKEKESKMDTTTVLIVAVLIVTVLWLYQWQVARNERERKDYFVKSFGEALKVTRFQRDNLVKLAVMTIIPAEKISYRKPGSFHPLMGFGYKGELQGLILSGLSENERMLVDRIDLIYLSKIKANPELTEFQIPGQATNEEIKRFSR